MQQSQPQARPARRPHQPRSERFSVPFTDSEKQDLNYTIFQAVEAARVILRERRFRGGLCVNALNGRPDNTKITLVELNNITDQLVSDSFFHHVD